MADSRLFEGARPVPSMRACCTGSSFQLLFVTVAIPWPCNSRTGSASALGTLVMEGPSARSRTRLGALPVTIKPPMPTLSPVWTRMRVERLSACVAGVGVAVGVGVGGGGVAVAVGVGGGGVAVAVGVGGVGVAVAVGVGGGGVAVAVGVGGGGVAVAVGVGGGGVAVAVGVGGGGVAVA